MSRCTPTVPPICLLVLYCCIFWLTTVSSYCATTLSKRPPHRLCAKSKGKQPNFNKVDAYLAMKELQKIKTDGGGYQEYLARKSGENGTESASSIPGYKRLVGRKGSLEQRLRAVVAYKRSSSTADSILSSISDVGEDVELEEAMDDDSDDLEVDYDDEEAVYERLVMEVIQESKLSELQKNFQLEINAAAKEEEDNSKRRNVSLTSTGQRVETYTPSKSGSWGVFERPVDISKAYGGGRTITREEMKRMDEEFERREQEEERKKREIISGAVKVENANEKAIKNAISSCRNFMRSGNTKAAVKSLEDVRNNLNFNTELCGEAYLELGMALETVDRSEEARKIYGQLVAVSYSQKVRRNALGLLQGLELTMKLKKRGPQTTAPIVDMQSLNSLSAVISQGLTNEWDQYKKKEFTVTPWLDLGGKSDEELFKVETIFDAYNLIIRALSPLKLEKLPSDVIRRALRKVYVTSDKEKIEFIKSKMPTLLSSFQNKEIPKMNYSPVTTNLPQSPPSNRPLLAMFDGEVNVVSDQLPVRRNINTAITITPVQVYENYLNGSWDLVLSIYDKASLAMRKYEIGDVRREIFYNNITGKDKIIQLAKNDFMVESSPTMWGMSRSQLKANISLIANGILIADFENNGKSSPSPWQQFRSSMQQELQVVWVDTDVMVTRQQNSNRVNDPDLYALWKRMKPTKYNKY